MRERRGDIPLLLAHFINQFARTRNRVIKSLTAEATQCLVDYEWRGNVRELENLVERLSILNPGREIDVEDLPEKFTGARHIPEPGVGAEIPDTGIQFNQLVDQYERVLIQKALAKAGGVKNKAAGLLNIKRTTLVEKMKKKGMID